MQENEVTSENPFAQFDKLYMARVLVSAMHKICALYPNHAIILGSDMNNHNAAMGAIHQMGSLEPEDFKEVVKAHELVLDVNPENRIEVWHLVTTDTTNPVRVMCIDLEQFVASIPDERVRKLIFNFNNAEPINIGQAVEETHSETKNPED